MRDLFARPDDEACVLSHDAGQFSMRPARVPIPAGWSAAHGPLAISECRIILDGRFTSTLDGNLA